MLIVEENGLNLECFTKLNAAFGSLPMVAVVFDIDKSKVIFANRAAAQFFGANQYQLTTRTTSSFLKTLSEENQATFKSALESPEAGGWDFENGLIFNSPNGAALVHGCVVRLDDAFYDARYAAILIHEWNDIVGTPLPSVPQLTVETSSGTGLITPSDFTNDAITDKLTGITTRRILLKELEEYIMRAIKGETGFTLILADLDHFNDVNSTSGTAAGDRVLKEFVDRMKRELRGPDKIYRVGGEEFIIVLPNLEYAGAALSVAERLRRSVEVEPVAGHRITASFGLTPWDKSMLSPEDILTVAEAALERAKQSGRNTVCKVA